LKRLEGRFDSHESGSLRLEQLLRLSNAGVSIRAITIFGDGEIAAVEIELSNDVLLECEKFGDLWTPAGMAKFVASRTGIRVVGMKKAEAEEAYSLIRRVAHVVGCGPRIGATGRGIGLGFLRLARVHPFRLTISGRGGRRSKPSTPPLPSAKR
jgi:hypothetical protein